MTAPAFSSSAEDAITRTLPVARDTKNAPNPITSEDLTSLAKLYEVEWTANEIRNGRFKQVALQFPDELLHISVPIYQLLKKQLNDDVGVYVLADTSYGSCCVDEVAAQHIDADLVVHYGYSCLSRPTRLPVLYVFSKAQINVQDAAQSLLTLAQDECSATGSHNFILIPDVAYAHVAGDLHAAILSSQYFPQNAQVFYNEVPSRDDPIPPPPLVKPSLETSQSEHASSPETQSSHPATSSHRRYTLPPSIPLATCTILHVGPESLGLTNLLMTHPENKVLSYDPTSEAPGAKLESARTNRLLMRRYAVVQRARDADVIGILVGTLGVASYLPLLSHIRTMLRAHHKKSYTLSVGKLSPSKLANFAEIECFVLVACPENSVIDAKEFLRPIVTPFELSLALSAEPSWPGSYVLDFERVIEEHVRTEKDTNDEATGSDSDRPTFSLMTGKYRHAKRYGETVEPEGSSDPSAIVVRSKESAIARLPDSAGAEYLRHRTFKGLEQRLGEDAPSPLEQGRSGIAKGYQDDHQPLPEDEG